MSHKIKTKPEIRFSGYTDDWEQRKFGSLITKLNEIVSGKSGLHIATSSRKGLFLQDDYFNGKRLGTNENVDFHRLPKGYITYRHMSDDSVFRFNRNDFNFDVLVSKEYPVFKSNNESNETFLLAHLNSSKEFLRFSMMQKSGGTRVRLYLKVLKDYKLMVPSISEQDKIGTFFKQLDDTIALHQRQLEALEKTKKSFLQKMFPKKDETKPEIRFAGFTDDWEQRKFKNIVLRKSKNSNSDKLPKVEFEDIVAGQGRLNKDVSQKFDDRKGILFTKSDILYGKLRPYLKNWLLADFDGIALGDFWVFECNNSIPEFVYTLIQSDMYQRVANDTSGTKMPRSDWTKVSNTDFFIPNEEEQQKIGTFFKQLDDTIALHQRQLEALEKIKKSFLQKMFV
ncbi:MAG: restriction endonuclease subunit S [Vagococcus lutrae]|nr:restriction endonuclease subunit S [Vagococcus lutrae]MDY3706911.1 restriction endonuclease subunit S [Vagococcus lutrae]